MHCGAETPPGLVVHLLEVGCVWRHPDSTILAVLDESTVHINWFRVSPNQRDWTLHGVNSDFKFFAIIDNVISLCTKTKFFAITFHQEHDVLVHVKCRTNTWCLEKGAGRLSSHNWKWCYVVFHPRLILGVERRTGVLGLGAHRARDSGQMYCDLLIRGCRRSRMICVNSN